MLNRELSHDTLKMADDSSRDLLPVRDGSFVESYRSIMAMTTDPRDRHTISKIDRDDLEDKYLRLLEECQQLRKLSNTQEDKIKRLGTKLMRVSATPKSCISSPFDANSNENRIDMLKLENLKLKDKIVVLRNQILSHRVLRRSPSQTRRLTICTSSRPTTCRSDSGRMKSLTCQNYLNDRDDDVVSRTYINKIGELEEQRKQMIGRIDDLQNKLALSQAGFQKDKIAENVEYIRARREMKLCHEKLMEAEAMKKVLTAQVQEMKSLLDETMKDNGQITATLDAERKRLSEMDERISRSQDNQLREKDEQIRDLMNEIKILQQHNSELLTLSSTYSIVETENAELKKKLSESLADNHSLKSACCIEQTNIKALQAANEKLLEKLQSTQSNIDNLTVQLKSMQNQHQISRENIVEVNATREETVEKFDKQTSTTSLLSTSKSIEVIQLKDRNTSQSSLQTSQNEECKSQHQSSLPIEQSHHAHTPSNVKIETQTIDEPEVTPENKTFDNGNNKLSRDEMLKLLDDAQINTPLNTKSAISVRQIEDLKSKPYTDANYRQSSSTLRSSRSSPHSSPPRKAIHRNKIQDRDHREIIKQICKILEDYFQTHFNETCHHSTTSLQSNALPRSSNTMQVHRSSTEDKAVSPTFPHPPQGLHDQNNNNIQSKMYNDDMTNPPNQNWNFEDEMLQISMTTMYHDLEESEQCICADIEKFHECRCSKDDRKCEIKISYHSSFATIDNINTSVQKTVNDDKTSCYQSCRPMPKTEQLRTGLCCKPDYPMKNEYSRDSSLVMEKPSILRHQAATSSEKTRECRRCPIFNNERTNDASRIDEEDEYEDNMVDALDRYFPPLITDSEGLVEIHILSLRFSHLVKDSLFRENGNVIQRSFLISCEFSGQKPISTSVIKYPDTNFNSSCIFQVANVDEFRKKMSQEYVYFQLHIVFDKDLSYIIAHGKMSAKDILIHPENKHHYVVDMESLVPCYRNQTFGQLSLWIGFSCHTNPVKLFKEEKQLDQFDRNLPIDHEVMETAVPNCSEVRDDEPPGPMIGIINRPVPENTKCGTATSKESRSIVIKPCEEQRNSKASRNDKAINTSKKSIKTQSTDPIPNPWQPWQRKDHVNETHRETDKWKQSRNLQNDRDTHHQKRRWLDNDNDSSNDALVVRIERLKLVQHCPLFHNPNIHRLYIEFFFLGGHGVDYETISVPIPKLHSENMYFNYVRKFRLDEQNHSNERNYLRRILLGEEDPNVQFNVVSEPLVDKMETEECLDVGHTHFNLKEHILNECNPDIFLPVRNPENTDSIGVLKISILGTNAIRRSLAKSPPIEES